MPSVIYTSPEVATVVLYKSCQFPMRALGRTRASGNLILIGARASDMIMEAIIAMEFSADAEDIAIISHTHPSFTEAIREAALATTENRPKNTW